jgi:hypothetical protein
MSVQLQLAGISWRHRYVQNDAVASGTRTLIWFVRCCCSISRFLGTEKGKVTSMILKPLLGPKNILLQNSSCPIRPS